MYEFIMLNQWKYRKGGCREKVWCGDSLTHIVQKIYDFKRERWIKFGIVASSVICNSRQQTHGLRVSPSKLIPDLSPKKIETGKKHYYHFLVIKYFCHSSNQSLLFLVWIYNIFWKNSFLFKSPCLDSYYLESFSWKTTSHKDHLEVCLLHSRLLSGLYGTWSPMKYLLLFLLNA